MHLPTTLLLLLLLHPPKVHPSTPFTALKGLTTLPHDLSTTDTRHPEKYFHESILHPHYDGRFGAAILPPNTRLLHLRLLLGTWAAFTRAQGVRMWIAHGTLLGWWWGGGIMRWDSDVDCQVDEGGMRELARWWNMSVHVFEAGELGIVSGSESQHTQHSRPWDANTILPPQTKPPSIAEPTWDRLAARGKTYLLEINPHHANASTADKRNVIDARWIDVETGLFVDITTVHAVEPGAPSVLSRFPLPFAAGGEDGGFAYNEAGGGVGGGAGEMYTKDTHVYPRAALFPLRETRIEGVKVKVPYAYEALLLDEYGEQALTETWFRGYVFDKGKGEWVVAPDEQEGGWE